MSSQADARKIVQLAREMLADERYGKLTNPVVLGLLTAAQLIDPPEPSPPAVTPPT